MLPPKPTWVVVHKYGLRRGSWLVEFWYVFARGDSEDEARLKCLEAATKDADTASVSGIIPAIYSANIEFLGTEVHIVPACFA